MSNSDTPPSHDQRIAMASRIQNEPSGYKICECCGSIVVANAHVCPNCNAYRFDPDEERVREQAQLLASREPLSVDKMDYY